MKTHKKATALILLLALCLSMLAGCGGQPANTPEVPDTGAVESPVDTGAVETPAPDTGAEDPVDTPTGEPEDTAPEYVFEGPGIFNDLVNHPDSYTKDAAQPGTVVQVPYNNGTDDKYFNIYLPYGYDAAGEQTYNVVYISHGGGGGPENFLRTDRATAFQKVMDNMIANGDVDPFIVVAITWKSPSAGEGADSMAQSVAFARDEFAQYVIPAVDANYRTNATREGRAFAGFSMGGVTTWNIFMYALPSVRYFIPMSGDCWAVESTGGATKPAETVAALEASVSAQGCTPDDFVMYIYTGTEDYALPNMAPQIYAMQGSEIFRFGENTYFGAYVSGVHGDPWSKTYLYNALPLMWQEG